MFIGNILVFPCGSEIGLEVYRSLSFSPHVRLFGGSSVDDHGKFVYDNYIGNLPFIDSPDFIGILKKIIIEKNIKAIFPAMDSAVCLIKRHESELGCKVICSEILTTEICLSKLRTYDILKSKIKVPVVFESLDEVKDYPVFLKPDIGYGSRCVLKANNKQEAKNFISKNRDKKILILEYLPGNEFTVDCFTNRHGELLFVGPRERNRISNGISVNTKPVLEKSQFIEIAKRISEVISFRGAWFFQLKEDSKKCLTLLEAAARFGGSSSLYRCKGVNFALLSVYDMFEIDVEVFVNDYQLELDRALSNRYVNNLVFDTIYVDFDDCLIINNKLNVSLINFLYKSLNENKKLILITKNEGDLFSALKRFRIDKLFDEVNIINKSDSKVNYIKSKNAIFIDDSFKERKEIKENLGIPVFSPDMIECLI
jgi:hypothetical protein